MRHSNQNYVNLFLAEEDPHPITSRHRMSFKVHITIDGSVSLTQKFTVDTKPTLCQQASPDFRIGTPGQEINVNIIFK